MGEQDQQERPPERRTLSFPVRGRDERGVWVDTGGTFPLEVWVPGPDQMASIQAGMADAVGDEDEGALVQALGDLVVSLILMQATDPERGRQLKSRLWDGRVSTVEAVRLIADLIGPNEPSTEPNREERRAALKATRKPQQRQRQGGNSHGRSR